MITRSAILKQYLEEGSTTTISVGSHQSISEESEPNSKHTSLRTFTSDSRMEEANAALAAPLRKKLERIQAKTSRSRERLNRQRDQDSPSTSNYDLLQDSLSQLEAYQKEHNKLSEELFEVETNPSALSEDESKADDFEHNMTTATRDCLHLISQRTVYRDTLALETAVRSLTTAYETSPENEHEAALGLVQQRTSDLENDLLSSLMSEDEELRGRATSILERSATIQGRVAGMKISDVKPAVKTTTKSNVKLKYIDIPSFSGKTEDWLPFKRLFYKAVHTNENLDDDTRLTYLVQAMEDPRVKSELSERLDEPGAYAKILSELESEHDKPRWMHRRYCESMKTLAPNPHTREGMKQLISQVTVILNGFIRLKGENCRQILTSVTEAIMDPQLRALWNQRTDTRKTTHPIEELLQFIKDQADQLEDDSGAATPKSTGGEKARYLQGQRHKGSTHSVVSPLPSGQMKVSQPKQGYQSYSRPPSTNVSSTCSLCQGGHHLFYCPTFEGYTVAQRKEHVMALKLCLNCLKANHVAHDCRSSYRCKANNCGRKHNSLLHEDRTAAPTMQQPAHQSNAATHSEESDQDEEDEECLLMTAKVTLIGPTQKVMTVRALLDAGSTLSIISTKLMRFLSLEKTGKEVSISGIKSKTSQQTHPMAKVTLASEFSPDWKRDITVAGLDEVIRQLPLQEAHSVKRMKHIQNLSLADDQFDQPGKIDLLLGQNVWRHLFLDGRIKGAEEHYPEAWLTVFGWTILGAYNPHSKPPSQPAITHVVASIEENKISNKLLSRFFELEEPSLFETAQSPTEMQVEAHYKDTHQYDEEQKRYIVRLPKSEDPPSLGESRTQAINRAGANERSLIKKGKLQSFQQVMQEYVDLGHAQEVSVHQHHPQIMAYYMPVHAVFKDRPLLRLGLSLMPLPRLPVITHLMTS